MENRPQHNQDLDTAVAIARLGEQMKHMEKTLNDGFKRLETRLDAESIAHTHLKEKVEELEKRVDKVYWVWGAAVFIGTPVMVIVTAAIKHMLGF